MTYEEIVDACCRPVLRENGRIDWGQSEECILPDDFQKRIVAAIRTAVAEERAACIAIVRGITVGEEWACNDNGDECGSEESGISCLARAIEALEARNKA